MVTYRTVYIYICFSTHTCIFLLCQLTGPRNKDDLGAMSTPNAQLLISNIILQEKEPGILGKIANSRPRGKKIKDKLGTSCTAIK